jgi:hypothetical protein
MPRHLLRNVVQIIGNIVQIIYGQGLQIFKSCP